MFLRHVAETAFYTGVSRGISIDFKSGKMAFYPPDLSRIIINNYEHLSIQEILKKNKAIEDDLKFVIDKLIQESIFFTTDLPESFKDASLDFHNFRTIDNMHIELPDFTFNHANAIKSFISHFMPRGLKLDIRMLSSVEEMEKWLTFFAQLPIQSIECVVDFESGWITIDTLENLIHLNGAITLFSVFNKPNVFQFKQEFAKLTRIIDGEIPFPKFFPSMELYLESMNYHTYFHLKLYINRLGEIKGAQELDSVFGTLETISPSDASVGSVNQNYSQAKKERCDICRDCEFRHICIDNRIPLSREDNFFFFEDECNFNPYISKWKGEIGYENLAYCGIQSDKNGFHINKEQLARVNKKIWG